MAWVTFTEKLRPFQLGDTSGKVWSSDRLRGKSIVIHLWATYSAPSVMEMERFSKLHAALGDRDDVQLLSFNVDEDLNAFKSFIAGKAYPYPVMAAYHYAKQFMEFVSVPRMWIVGPKGEWTWEKDGFDLKGLQSVDDILRRIPSPEPKP